LINSWADTIGREKEERGRTTETSECAGLAEKRCQRTRTRLGQQTTTVWRGLHTCLWAQYNTIQYNEYF